MRKGTPAEIATQESVNTRYGVERVIRYAFEKAMNRPRRKLTLVHKTNVLTYAGDLWQRTVDELAKDYPDVAVEYSHVDAASMFFVSAPERFDVIVTDNLFGDILTDLGAAVTGGIGLAASGNINPPGSSPSMFEPVHGSAPDIAGTGKADPTAAILSAAMLCDHLGLTAAAARIEQAVGEDLVERQGAWAARTTVEVGSDIAERVAGLTGSRSVKED
jgi:3-isopropylmalate dehydrogenase